jgi:hypothetical protein
MCFVGRRTKGDSRNSLSWHGGSLDEFAETARKEAAPHADKYKYAVPKTYFDRQSGSYSNVSDWCGGKMTTHMTRI